MSKILIVDDDPGVLGLLKAYFEKQAKNAEDALVLIDPEQSMTLRDVQKFPNFVFSLSFPKSQRSSPLRLGLIGDPIGFPPKACGNDEVGECLRDVTMPGMSGLEVLQKIRAKMPDVVVAMITGLHDEHLAREAASLGAYSYVTKPFDLYYLELVVSTGLMMCAEEEKSKEKL